MRKKKGHVTIVEGGKVEVREIEILIMTKEEHEALIRNVR